MQQQPQQRALVAQNIQLEIVPFVADGIGENGFMLRIRDPIMTEGSIRLPLPPDFAKITRVVIDHVGVSKMPTWIAEAAKASMPQLSSMRIVGNPIEELDGALTIPSRLSRLEIVNCGLTSFPKNLPDSLRKLDLSSNRIDDPTGFDSLPFTLRAMSLTRNRVTLLPKRFPLRLLVKLILDDNELTELPNGLPSTLRILSVNRNSLVSLPTRLPTELRTLRASDNLITEIDLDSLVKSKNLTTIDLSRNRIESIGSGFLPPNLKVLSLHTNEITHVESLVFPSTIRLIDLSKNKLRRITGLKFAREAVGGNDPTGVASLSPANIPDGRRRIRSRRFDHRFQNAFFDEEPINLDETDETTESVEFDTGVSISLESNTRLTHLDCDALPSNIIELDVSHCSLRELPHGLRTKTQLQSLNASSNRITRIHVDDYPLSLVALDLSRNLISHIVEHSRSAFAFAVTRTTNLRRLDLSNNAIRSIPSSFLAEVCGGLKWLRLDYNPLTMMPSPLSPVLTEFSISNCFISSLGNVPLPATLVMLNASMNAITSLSGPALLGCTEALVSLSLEGNSIRYVSPDVRNHVEVLSAAAGDNESPEWGGRRRFQILDSLPTGTIYADREIVHQHSVQESVRESISHLVSLGQIEKAPEIDVVAVELLAIEPLPISIVALRSMLLNSGLLTVDDTIDGISHFSRTTTPQALLASIVPADQRIPGENTRLPTIDLGTKPSITFANLLRIIWSVIREHPERVTMLKNLDADLGRQSVPCLTGLIGPLVGCIAGFEGVASGVSIRISKAEQMAAIIESTGRIVEKRGIYSVEAHRQAAREEMAERGIEEIDILTWVAAIDSD